MTAPKPLTVKDIEKLVLAAVEKGPNAVQVLCAGTDDARLANFVQNYAPSRIRVGREHEERRAKVHAALRAEQERRRGQLAKRADANAITIKIGTMPQDVLRLCKRRPPRGLFPAIRGVPFPGELFYVYDRTGWVTIPLRCTHINEDGLIFAERM
jgi:hypothetical protein